MTTFSWYLAAFSWSTMVLTGTGGTDFYPSGRSDGETAVVLCLVILGAFLWTFVLASFCDVATNSNPSLSMHHPEGPNPFFHQLQPEPKYAPSRGPKPLLRPR